MTAARSNKICHHSSSAGRLYLCQRQIFQIFYDFSHFNNVIFWKSNYVERWLLPEYKIYSITWSCSCTHANIQDWQQKWLFFLNRNSLNSEFIDLVGKFDGTVPHSKKKGLSLIYKWMKSLELHVLCSVFIFHLHQNACMNTTQDGKKCERIY